MLANAARVTIALLLINNSLLVLIYVYTLPIMLHELGHVSHVRRFPLSFVLHHASYLENESPRALSDLAMAFF